jgi:hypothetical protein
MKSQASDTLTLKEVSIPQALVGDLIEITVRSRKNSEVDAKDATGDWPQYLSEQEVLEIMHIMSEK